MARREHSRAELEQKLKPHAADATELAGTLDFMAAKGWLSDGRYAAEVVRAKGGRQSRGKVALQLRGKGVGEEEIAAAVEGMDDFATASAIWRRKFGAPPVDLREKARQVRFLQSRGFSMEVALRVLRQAGVVDEDDT